MKSAVEEFKGTLRTDGLRGAMRWLNDRVPYRYTAIFAFDGDMLHNLCLVDKQDQSIASCSDQAITASYCMYIRRSEERFDVEATLSDARVAGHPKRQIVQCYYGIPLFDTQGKILGTVCHFDSMPVRITDDVAAALDDLAPLISEAAFTSADKH